MIRRLACLSAMALFLGSGNDCLAGQSLPKDLKEWRLDYGRSGGIAGMMLHVTVGSDGAIVVEDKARDGRVTGRASDDLMVKLSAFLQGARDEKPSAVKRTPIPDQMGQWLSITPSGREYRLEVTSQIMDLMDDAMRVAERQALVGTWGQSAWRLCKPAAHLAASDTDPPIEALVFEADGTFSVTWKGGGAHTTGVPHVAIPDYRGRYDVFPQNSSIQMRIENGISVPNDFSGRGSFRVTANELTLRNVWLGTRRAKQKPDICELTFTRR